MKKILLSAATVILLVAGSLPAAAASLAAQPQRSLQEQLAQLQNALAPHTPTEAASLYAKGLKERNGALQYTVLAENLRDQLRPALEANHWVTGVSSPWINDYAILKETRISDTVANVLLDMDSATSTGFAGVTRLNLRVEKQDGHWYITSITSEKGVADLKLGSQSLTLPDGSKTEEPIANVRFGNRVLMLRSFAVDKTEDPVQNVIDFYPDGKILKKEPVTLSGVGPAQLVLVQREEIKGKPYRHFYLITFRPYPDRTDKVLAYTIMEPFTGDENAAKNDLLRAAVGWKVKE